jgi:hypothetical protein
MFIITIRKLANTNKNIDEIFSSVYYDNLYQYNFSSMYPSVNIDRKTFLVYTEGIIMEK